VTTKNIAVVDLGAESGRVLLARFNGTQITLQDVHRFPNKPVRLLHHLHWNLPTLWQELLTGLKQAWLAADGELHSVGVDTWAVDYGLLDAAGELLGLPFHYRDARTNGTMEQVTKHLTRANIYNRTGIQFLPFNTLYQLVAQQETQSGLLAYADRLLMIPDLLHYWLSGVQVSEYTNVTTTQFWSVPEQRWSQETLTELDLPTHLLPPVVQPGTVLGPLQPELASELGTEIQVIVPATHDTAAAIAAIPAEDAPGWAYISSGTWSLVGLELPAPLIVPGLADNFTNEGGIFNTVRYLRNVMGLWLVQECRNTWATQGREFSYNMLVALAEEAPHFTALIHPDESSFLAPGDMPSRIRSYLATTGQQDLETPGALIRCILESLTLRYRQVLEMAENASAISLRTVHIVGGGSQNAHLNQWLANATGLPVLAGPVEASALGNALTQLIGLGEVNTLAELRALARASTQIRTYMPDPVHRDGWDAAYQRFLSLPQNP
jgi:rhamnulokinase